MKPSIKQYILCVLLLCSLLKYGYSMEFEVVCPPPNDGVIMSQSVKDYETIKQHFTSGFNITIHFAGDKALNQKVRQMIYI